LGRRRGWGALFIGGGGGGGRRRDYDEEGLFKDSLKYLIRTLPGAKAKQLQQLYKM